MDANGIKLVDLQNFETCPVWRYDEDDDLYFPVLTGKDLPEFERDVAIFVEYKTPSGIKFPGYIMGISKVFSLGLFCGGKTFYMNKNLPDLSAEQMSEFLECAGLTDLLSIKNLLPLEYVTKINHDEFQDFSGQFEMVLS